MQRVAIMQSPLSKIRRRHCSATGSSAARNRAAERPPKREVGNGQAGKCPPAKKPEPHGTRARTHGLAQNSRHLFEKTNRRNNKINIPLYTLGRPILPPRLQPRSSALIIFVMTVAQTRLSALFFSPCNVLIRPRSK